MQCVPTVAPVPCALCELSTAVVCCACYLLSRHTHTQGTLLLSNMSLCVWAAAAWWAGCMPPPPLHGCSPTKGVATAGAPRSLLLQPRHVTCAADGPIVPGTRCSPLLVYLENHPGTPSSATPFSMRHAAALFLLWERLSTPEFECVFAPRKASFPCIFLQTRVQSHGYTETRCARSIVRMCVHINTPNAAGRREGSLGRHGTWLQHP